MYKEEYPEYRKMTEGTPRMLRIATVKSRWERPVTRMEGRPLCVYVLALGSFVTLEDPLSAVLSGLQVSDAFPPQAWR